jgi:hypothetical protein
MKDQNCEANLSRVILICRTKKTDMPLLKTQIEKPKFSLEDIFEKEVHVYSKTIYCKALNKPNYALTIKEYEKQLNIIIDDLKDFNCPCLYWFSAESPESALILMEQLNQFRSSKHEHKRTLPAKNKNKNSNVIYVGKSWQNSNPFWLL